MPRARATSAFPKSIRHTSRYPADLATLERGERQGRAGRDFAFLRPAGRRERSHQPVRRVHRRLAAGNRRARACGYAACRGGRPSGFDFTGRLPFDWPAGDCLPKNGGVQFRRGYGLSLASRSTLGKAAGSPRRSWSVQPKVVNRQTHAENPHRRWRDGRLDDRRPVRQAVPGTLRHRAGRE